MSENLFPLGALKDPYDPRDIIFGSVVPSTVELPRKFSLREKQSPVISQNYGSCVGQAAKAMKEYQEKIQWLEQVLLSGRFAYAMAKTLDGIPTSEGTYPRVMMKVLTGVGIVKEEKFPNDPAPPTHQEYISPIPNNLVEEAIVYRIDGFARCISLEELKRAIYNYGPVMIAINVYDTFDNPVNGFIKTKVNPNSYRGGHAIAAIGWDDSKEGIGAIEIKNSWGTGWGDQGFAYLAYNYDGIVPFVDAWSTVDFIDAFTAQGAPIGLDYPVDAPIVITQAFGARPEYYAQYGLAGHNGLDFRARNAASIYACDNGEVIFTGLKGAYGNCVIIKHSWGISLYAHLSSILVTDNGGPNESPTPISRRTKLGLSGNTGNSEAEHLHFGIRINGVKNPKFFDWVDPTPYFKKKGDTMILLKAVDNPTVYAQFGDTLVGFATFEAYQKFIEGREAQIVEISAGELAKFKVAPVVIKL